MVPCFRTKPFFAERNQKKGSVGGGSVVGYSQEPFKSSVYFFIRCLDVLAQKEAF